MAEDQERTEEKACACGAKVKPPPAPRFGDRVRSHVGATGRYLRDGLMLYVSAMDNDLVVTPAGDGEPHPDLPVPTTRELEAACAGLRYARYSAPGAVSGGTPEPTND